MLNRGYTGRKLVSKVGQHLKLAVRVGVGGGKEAVLCSHALSGKKSFSLPLGSSGWTNKVT